MIKRHHSLSEADKREKHSILFTQFIYSILLIWILQT